MSLLQQNGGQDNINSLPYEFENFRLLFDTTLRTRKIPQSKLTLTLIIYCLKFLPFIRSFMATIIALALSSAPCFALFSAAPENNKKLI